MSDSSITQATGTTEGPGVFEEMDTQEAQYSTVSSTDPARPNESGDRSINQGQDEAESQPIGSSGTKLYTAYRSQVSFESSSSQENPAKPDEIGDRIINQDQDEAESQPIDSSGTKLYAPIRSQGSFESNASLGDEVESLAIQSDYSKQQTSLTVASTAGESKATFGSDHPTGVAQAMQSEKPATEEVMETTAELLSPEPKSKKTSPMAKVMGLISKKKKLSPSSKSSSKSPTENTSSLTSPKASGSKFTLENVLTKAKRKLACPFSSTVNSDEESVCDPAQTSLSIPETDLVEKSPKKSRKHLDASDTTVPESFEETSRGRQELPQQGHAMEPLPQQEQLKGRVEDPIFDVINIPIRNQQSFSPPLRHEYYYTHMEIHLPLRESLCPPRPPKDSLRQKLEGKQCSEEAALSTAEGVSNVTRTSSSGVQGDVSDTAQSARATEQQREQPPYPMNPAQGEHGLEQAGRHNDYPIHNELELPAKNEQSVCPPRPPKDSLRQKLEGKFSKEAALSTAEGVSNVSRASSSGVQGDVSDPAQSARATEQQR